MVADGSCIVVASHDSAVADVADRVLDLDRPSLARKYVLRSVVCEHVDMVDQRPLSPATIAVTAGGHRRQAIR